MGRLQDFPQVTPGASDNFLIVQSQGQGLAPQSIKMDSANPTGSGAVSIGRKMGTTTGSQSIALGYNAEASGARSVALGHAPTATGDNGSFAEGYQSKASGTYGAHAEGRNTEAKGTSSHAEGYGSIAEGSTSHAEGINTKAEGAYSHVEGLGTISNHRSQHVFGEYNVADTSSAESNTRGKYIEIVGKGTGDNNRSIARTLDWSGNETIAGTLTQSSDERLKHIKAEDIPDVSAVKAVRFTWKEDANRDSSEHIGYIAQDVEKVLPFLVKEDAEGNKVLDYIAFLVAKVDSLEKRIAELEK